MRELEPLLERRVSLPASTATRERVDLNLGPGTGIMLKRLDMLSDQAVTTTGFLLQGLATDPTMTNPSTQTAWIQDHRIPIQRLMVRTASGTGVDLIKNLHSTYDVPSPGLVLVSDFQLMMRITSGGGIIVSFTLWFKVVELDLGEWIYYTNRRNIGGN